MSDEEITNNSKCQICGYPCPLGTCCGGYSCIERGKYPDVSPASMNDTTTNELRWHCRKCGKGIMVPSYCEECWAARSATDTTTNETDVPCAVCHLDFDYCTCGGGAAPSVQPVDVREEILIAINSCKDVTTLGRFSTAVDPVEWVRQLQEHLECTLAVASVTPCGCAAKVEALQQCIAFIESEDELAKAITQPKVLALAHVALKESKTSTCKWTWNYRKSFWASSCGDAMELEREILNEFKACCFCGKPIEVVEEGKGGTEVTQESASTAARKSTTLGMLGCKLTSGSTSGETR